MLERAKETTEKLMKARAELDKQSTEAAVKAQQSLAMRDAVVAGCLIVCWLGFVIYFNM